MDFNAGRLDADLRDLLATTRSVIDVSFMRTDAADYVRAVVDAMRAGHTCAFASVEPDGTFRYMIGNYDPLLAINMLARVIKRLSEPSTCERGGDNAPA